MGAGAMMRAKLQKKPAAFTAVGKVANKVRYERRRRPDGAEASAAGRAPQGPYDDRS